MYNVNNMSIFQRGLHYRHEKPIMRTERIFDLDGTLCPSGGGSMRLIAALTDAISIRHYLTGVGLPAWPPPLEPSLVMAIGNVLRGNRVRDQFTVGALFWGKRPFDWPASAAGYSGRDTIIEDNDILDTALGIDVNPLCLDTFIRNDRIERRAAAGRRHPYVDPPGGAVRPSAAGGRRDAAIAAGRSGSLRPRRHSAGGESALAANTGRISRAAGRSVVGGGAGAAADAYRDPRQPPGVALRG